MAGLITIKTGGRVEVGTGSRVNAGTGIAALSDIEPDYAWWDFSDITTLFQDSILTTPVTSNLDPIGGVTDKSGSGRTIIQSLSARRPVYTTGVQNGLSTADANANRYVEITGANFGTLARPYTIVAVGRTPPNVPASFSRTFIDGIGCSASHSVALQLGPTSTLDGGMVYRTHGSGSGATQSVLFPNFAAVGANTWYIWAMVTDGTTFSTYVNNVFDINRASVDISTGMRLGHDCNLGSATQGDWSSDMGEVRLYDSELSSGDRTTIYNFLADKWAI